MTKAKIPSNETPANDNNKAQTALLDCQTGEVHDFKRLGSKHAVIRRRDDAYVVPLGPVFRIVTLSVEGGIRDESGEPFDPFQRPEAPPEAPPVRSLAPVAPVAPVAPGRAPRKGAGRSRGR